MALIKAAALWKLLKESTFRFGGGFQCTNRRSRSHSLSPSVAAYLKFGRFLLRAWGSVDHGESGPNCLKALSPSVKNNYFTPRPRSLR